jgi:4-carboxymuconolactone decarboxylase
MSRLLPPELDRLSPEQRRVYESIAAGPRQGVRGPFALLLHVPELANRVQQVGEYLRFQGCIPTRLVEIAILTAARHHGCEYAWQAHEPKARKAGVSQDTVDAIRVCRRPEGMTPEEAAVFGFTAELLQSGKVSDATYDAASGAFGTRGLVELGTLVGYYTMICIITLAHGIAVPVKPAQ